MRPSRNVIEHTWLAYALDRPSAGDDLEHRLARVGEHYARLIADRVIVDRQADSRTGLVLWRREDPRLRWPLWHGSNGRVMAATGVPTGWRRLTGQVALSEAPERLADVLAREPELAVNLNPPFVIGVRTGGTGALVIINDFLGAGRLFEMPFDGGWVWSNRLGALPLFAGATPEADEEGWAVFAAAGWFLGKTTPIKGARKVPPGTVIRVSCGDGPSVKRHETEAQRRAVEPRRFPFRAAAAEAAEQALGMALDLGAVWQVPIAIALTGGRDSRVSAAAALSAGLDATFNTGDQIPGEVDVVRELVRRAPTAMDHTVYQPELEGEAQDDLWQRIRAIHLVHDGMRNPQEVRRPTQIPQTEWPPPTLSGHGGELGHGFYYGSKRKLRHLKRGRDRAIFDQLEKNARRRHSAATPEAYELYFDECGRTLDQGRDFGLSGPALLDWFYMAQRLPYRSGLGARSGRSSVCITPAFVRGAFDLSPRDRLRARLHRAVVSRLVDAWSDVPFFRSDSEKMPEIRRARIWERPSEAAVVSEMLASDDGWTRVFEPDRIREMWKEVLAGGGSADYEHVFYRVVWRVGFERHLGDLAVTIGRRAERLSASPGS